MLLFPLLGSRRTWTFHSTRARVVRMFGIESIGPLALNGSAQRNTAHMSQVGDERRRRRRRRLVSVCVLDLINDDP